VLRRSEIDEQYRARKGFEQVVSDRDRGRSLADAAGADDGDEARSFQLSSDLENVVIAADHAR
jgi:hypothetical protein